MDTAWQGVPDGLGFPRSNTEGLVSRQGSWVSFSRYFEEKLEVGERKRGSGTKETTDRKGRVRESVRIGLSGPPIH